MANIIKNKYGDPIIGEFAPNDLVVNIVDGNLFFRSNTQLFQVEARISGSVIGAAPLLATNEGSDNQLITFVDNNEVQNESNLLFDGINFSVGDPYNPPNPVCHISCSGNISASGDIYADEGRFERNVWIGGPQNIGDDSSPRLRLSNPNTGDINIDWEGGQLLFRYDTSTKISFDSAGSITSSAHLSASGDVIGRAITASEGFHALSNTQFEFEIQGGNSANFIHKTANQNIFFLTTTGTGTLNFGTNNNNSEVVIGTGGHITASANISASGDVIAHDVIAKSSTSVIQAIDTTQNYIVELMGGGGPRVNFGDTDGTNDQFMILGAFSNINQIDTQGRDFHLYGTNTTTGFYFDESAGKFGIGTITPDEALEVVGSVYINAENHGFIIDAGDSQRIGLMKYSGHEAYLARTVIQDFGIVRVGGDDINDGGTINFDIYVSGSGNVGIGTTNTKEKLTVAGNISGSTFISGPTNTDEGGQLTMLAPENGTHRWMIDNYQNRCRIFRENSGGGGGSEVLSVTNNDRLGISDSSPSTKLDVNGTVTCTGFNNTSDIKLKTDINNIEAPLKTIQKLKGITFNWKNDIIGTDKSLQGTKHGFIAQEVEKILPSLVFEGKNKSINYIELIPILVESIKEQQQQINELKNKINYDSSSIR